MTKGFTNGSAAGIVDGVDGSAEGFTEDITEARHRAQRGCLWTELPELILPVVRAVSGLIDPLRYPRLSTG